MTALGIGAAGQVHVGGHFDAVSGQARCEYAVLPGADGVFRGDFGG